MGVVTELHCLLWGEPATSQAIHIEFLLPLHYLTTSCVSASLSMWARQAFKWAMPVGNYTVLSMVFNLMVVSHLTRRVLAQMTPSAPSSPRQGPANMYPELYLWI